jgi:signal transduction histidine kinase
MRLGAYLADRWPTLLIAVLVDGFLAMVLYVLGLDTGAIVFVELIALLGIAAALILDFLRRRRFYNMLRVASEALDQKHLIAEVVQAPRFLEGAVTYEALCAAGKSMNDAIASYRIASEEYRTYIETWVHEVKTPIATAALLVENNRDETTSAIESELMRIEAYVEQALYYARSMYVEQDYAIRAVDLEGVVKAALRRRARLLIEHDVAPRFEGLDLEVLADPKWLDFVIGQIVENAVKYRQAADGIMPLTFSACRKDEGHADERVVFQIADEGIGIPATDIVRVFDKGFTGENGRTHGRSTGIGLFLCKRLCDKMGLGIDISSAPGKGTQVRISFPANRMYRL